MSVEAEPRNVIIIVNVGGQDLRKVTLDAALAQTGGREALESLVFEREIDQSNMTARQWRTIAREIDSLVERADRLGESTPVRFWVFTRAPLPLVAYLGQRMRRMSGPITMANYNHYGKRWEHVADPPLREPQRRRMVRAAPVLPEGSSSPRGRLAISIRCSAELRYNEAQVAHLVSEDGGEFLGTFHIVHASDQQVAPLDDEDLLDILEGVREAVALACARTIESHGVTLTLAGPAWMAFWVGNRLNHRVVGRVDLPDFVPGCGYMPALALPMHRAPRLKGPAKVLVLAAEPSDQTPTDRARLIERVREELAAAAPEGRYVLECVDATRLGDVTRLLREHQPDILHIWMHGSPRGDVALEDRDGNLATIGPDSFVRILRDSGVRPELVVLGACHLEVIASKLEGLAGCVIASKHELDIERGLDLTGQLYRHLALGETLAEAFEAGLAAYRREQHRGQQAAWAKNIREQARTVAEDLEIHYFGDTYGTTPLFQAESGTARSV